jgi:hypothetical protein
VSDASIRFSPGISTPKSLGIPSSAFPLLALPLFMARVLAADHAHNVFVLHDFASFTKSFY